MVFPRWGGLFGGDSNMSDLRGSVCSLLRRKSLQHMSGMFHVHAFLGDPVLTERCFDLLKHTRVICSVPPAAKGIYFHFYMLCLQSLEKQALFLPVWSGRCRFLRVIYWLYLSGTLSGTSYILPVTFLFSECFSVSYTKSGVPFSRLTGPGLHL